MGFELGTNALPSVYVRKEKKERNKIQNNEGEHENYRDEKHSVPIVY